jgi:hypothetical protein
MLRTAGLDASGERIAASRVARNRPTEDCTYETQAETIAASNQTGVAYQMRHDQTALGSNSTHQMSLPAAPVAV